jgi:hypothetical protein
VELPQFRTKTFMISLQQIQKAPKAFNHGEHGKILTEIEAVPSLRTSTSRRVSRKNFPLFIVHFSFRHLIRLIVQALNSFAKYSSAQ